MAMSTDAKKIFSGLMQDARSAFIKGQRFELVGNYKEAEKNYATAESYYNKAYVFAKKNKDYRQEEAQTQCATMKRLRKNMQSMLSK